MFFIYLPITFVDSRSIVALDFTVQWFLKNYNNARTGTHKNWRFNGPSISNLHMLSVVVKRTILGQFLLQLIFNHDWGIAFVSWSSLDLSRHVHTNPCQSNTSRRIWCVLVSFGDVESFESVPRKHWHALLIYLFFGYQRSPCQKMTLSCTAQIVKSEPDESRHG